MVLVKLLVFGCSYTDSRYLELTAKDKNIKDHLKDNNGNFTKSFSFWPDLLAEKLNMKCENYAQCGFGNDGIYSTFVDTIAETKDIGLVIVMWSEFLRIGFEIEKRGPFKTSFDWFKINIGATNKNKELRSRQIEITEVLNKHGLISPNSLVRRSLRNFLSVQNICENMNIPYMQVMGMPPAKKSMEMDICKYIIGSPYLDKINRKTFLGWPMFPQIEEGFSCGGKLYDLDPNRDKYFINYNNVHPNAEGQKFISELLYRRVNNEIVS